MNKINNNIETLAADRQALKLFFCFVYSKKSHSEINLRNWFFLRKDLVVSRFGSVEHFNNLILFTHLGK